MPVSGPACLCRGLCHSASGRCHPVFRQERSTTMSPQYSQQILLHSSTKTPPHNNNSTPPPHASTPHYTTSWTLRSGNSNLLAVPWTKLANMGSHAFPSLGPRLWNNLLKRIRALDSLAAFKTNLKTHLFISAFTYGLGFCVF